MEASAPPRDFFDDLLEESRLVGRYRRWKGLGTPDKLWQAASEVEALPPPRSLGDPAVVRLLRALAECERDIPFSTLARLKEGWDPCRPSEADRRNTLFLIVVSVVLVFYTGALTNFYNKGVALLEELEELAPVETQQTYNRYLRDLLHARYQMNDALGIITDVEPVSSDLQVEASSRSSVSLAGPPLEDAQFDLARDVYYETEAELSALSQTIYSVNRRAIDFAYNEVPFAAPGQKMAMCSLARLRHLARKAFDWEAKRSLFLVSYCDPRTFGNLDQNATQLAPLEANCLDASFRNAPSMEVSGDLSHRANAYAKDLAGLAAELTCRRVLAFEPAGFPSIDSLAKDIKDALTPFGLLFLPALYGSIGAVLSLMRVVVEPLTPTPKAPAIFHRLTFGASAGVVLIWFVTPDSLVGTQIADIGLSLFGLTFLVGFSLDFFLSILDRFVFVSASSFGRLGDRPPEDAPPRSAQGKSAAG